MKPVSKFERVAILLKEKVEIGSPISNQELDDCIEVLQSILDFAGGYKDKILLTWAAMSLAPLEQIKRYRDAHPTSWFEAK